MANKMERWTINGNWTVEIPTKEIEKNMKDFEGISKEDAVRMWFEDNEYLDSGEKATITENTEKVKRRYEKSGKPRKASTRERKVDTEKLELIELVKALLDENAETTVKGVKTETEINFDFRGNEYTFKLTKHRPPKEEK